MKKPGPKQELRKRAEEKLSKSSSSPKEEMDEAKLLHELEVHQIELELQNEELREAFASQSEISKKYSELFESAPVGYLVLDPHSIILELNMAAAHMTGFPRDYLLKRRFTTLLKEEHKAIFTRFLYSVFMDKGAQICEVTLGSSDNSTNLYVEGRRQESGDSCMITLVDITSMKNFENHLKKLNKDLQDTIAIKDQILAIIGHDLKGPLTGILLFFNFFAKELGKSDLENVHDYIRDIVRDTEQALTLLDNLITWAKLKAGVAVLNNEKIDLKQFADKICESLSSKSENKYIRIINNIPDETYIFSDPNVLGILLSNLITNAIKFSFSHGIIEIDVQNLNKNMEIMIRDHGTGMTPEVLRNIFTAGKSNHTFGTENEPGSGFGLILCRELINLQEGECWIESRKDKGTIVHFTVKK